MFTAANISKATIEISYDIFMVFFNFMQSADLRKTLPTFDVALKEFLVFIYSFSNVPSSELVAIMTIQAAKRKQQLKMSMFLSSGDYVRAEMGPESIQQVLHAFCAVH